MSIMISVWERLECLNVIASVLKNNFSKIYGSTGI
jgi:hypothetical protein